MKKDKNNKVQVLSIIQYWLFIFIVVMIFAFLLNIL